MIMMKALAVSAILLAHSVAAVVPTFDYIIVGGGTAGLVLANRLSALSHVRVAIIEPGGDERGNVNVTSVNSFPNGYNSPVDWNYTSVAQANAGGRVLDYHAGKAIGGTSTINGMTYIRAQKAQINAWEALGNPGWNWDTLLPYYKKAEHYDAPTPAQALVGGTYEPLAHGETGPLHVGYPFELANGSFFSTARDTWAALGQPLNRDVNTGDVHGFDVWPKTCVRDLELRADAAQAYYWPIAGRPNLRLFRGMATRILWEKSAAVARGVEYVTANGTKVELAANKEVILSAGSLRTPAILELSGVGNPKILAKYGITTKVALPGVGENLVDQPNVFLAWLSNTSLTGLAPYATFPKIAELFGKDVSAAVKANLTAWAKDASAASGGAVSAAAIKKLYDIQHTLIFNASVPTTELLTTFSSGLLITAFWPLLPFSRGSVHIGSADPLRQPAIDPRFFSVGFDLDATVAAARLANMFWATAPAAGLVEGAAQPDAATIMPNASDADWASYLVGSFSSNSHPLGTAAMMDRALGGVVDPQLQVYGTANVRVVDASVLPMQVSGHLTSTIYAVAERAADIIKQGI